MILSDLSKAIYEFLGKGNKPEDVVIKMGTEFYSKFIEACGSQINASVRGVDVFMGIPVEQTHYLEKNKCALINERIILSDWKIDWRINGIDN